MTTLTRSLIVVMALVVAFTTSACSGGPKSPTGPLPTPPPTEPVHPVTWSRQYQGDLSPGGGGGVQLRMHPELPKTKLRVSVMVDPPEGELELFAFPNDSESDRLRCRFEGVCEGFLAHMPHKLENPKTFVFENNGEDLVWLHSRNSGPNRITFVGNIIYEASR